MKSQESRKKEYYHVYNRGIEKRTLFYDKEDFDRFRAYLYLLNDQESMRVSNFFAPNRVEHIFDNARGEQLVAIGAYCLLPNRFDLLLTPLVENGVTKFMQRVQTAYAMYFNDKRERSGRLYESTYKSQRCQNDEQIKFIFAYIHLNPVTLFDKDWQSSNKSEIEQNFSKVTQYEYSSIGEYMAKKVRILSTEKYPHYICKPGKRIDHLRFWHRHKDAFSDTK